MDNGTSIPNSAIDIHCEKCGRLFYVDMYDVEEMEKGGSPFLCADCMPKQEVTEEGQRFEYLVSHIFAEREAMETELNRLGSEGWELIMQIQDNLVFKREQFG